MPRPKEDDKKKITVWLRPDLEEGVRREVLERNLAARKTGQRAYTMTSYFNDLVEQALRMKEKGEKDT